MTTGVGTAYPFASGDRLNDRNTYFYVPFQGAAFLEAWRTNRDTALAELPTARAMDAPAADDLPSLPFMTQAALESAAWMLRTSSSAPAVHDLAKHLLRRFEVSKRIHTAYAGAFRPAAGAAFDRLDLYVMFGQVLEACYRGTGRLYYLNGLLKVNDTVIASRGLLDARAAAALAWLILREREHIAALAAGQGIPS